MTRRPRLTYANVTSTLALVLALSGGVAYANHEFINSSDVEDNSLTGEDIRGSFPDSQQGFIEGTLTTQDIADGTLFPSDIADNTIGPADILTVGSGDIGPNAVNGGHVADETLSGGDIANDTVDGFDVKDLTGLDLIDGSVGSEDLAPAARGFTQTSERTATRRLDRGDSTIVMATCREGWRVISGGFSNNSARHPEDIAVRGSYRRSSRVWAVDVKHVGGVGAADITVYAWALCVR